MIFDDSLLPSPDPDDLRGGRRASRRFIDWQTFSDFGDNNHRPNKKLDTILSSPLFDLIGIAPGDVQSLAQRNLLRQLALALPSGQSVARAMEEDVLARAEAKSSDKQLTWVDATVRKLRHGVQRRPLAGGRTAGSL